MKQYWRVAEAIALPGLRIAFMQGVPDIYTRYPTCIGSGGRGGGGDRRAVPPILISHRNDVAARHFDVPTWF